MTGPAAHEAGRLRRSGAAAVAYSDAADGHGLALVAIASRAIKEGWRARMPPPPAPIARHWAPHAGTISVEPARFSARHPELWFAFVDVPCRAAPKRRQPSRFYWRGRVESGLMCRTMRTTGNIEFVGLQAVELDPAVAALIEQPIVVRYEHAGCRRRHTPDLYVERCAPPHGFIEFKPEEVACRPELEEEFQARGAALAAAGYTYTVLTDRHLRVEPLAENLELVHRLRHQRAAPEQVTTVRHALVAAGTMPLGNLCREAGLTIGQVCFLLRHCVVGADLWNVPLDEQMPLWLRVRGHQPRPDGRLVPGSLR